MKPQTFAGITCIITVFLCGQKARSYEVLTHAWIGHQAFMIVSNSAFGREVLAHDALGNYPLTVFQECSDDADTGRQLLEGMVEEDDVCFLHQRPAPVDSWARPLNHFWLPEGGINRGLFHKNSAVDKARILWDLSLRAYLCQRDTNLAYWYLGRVAHLLQDMASPAHTHLDNHFTQENLHVVEDVFDLADSYEKWSAQTDGLHNIPQHEEISFRDADVPDVEWMKGFEISTAYDRHLVTLFHSLASLARGFDSDDSGYLDVPASTEHGGRYNSFQYGLNPGYDFAGYPPTIFWLRQTTSGNPSSATETLWLARGVDYEFDDFEIVNYQHHPRIAAPVAV